MKEVMASSSNAGLAITEQRERYARRQRAATQKALAGSRPRHSPKRECLSPPTSSRPPTSSSAAHVASSAVAGQFFADLDKFYTPALPPSGPYERTLFGSTSRESLPPATPMHPVMPPSRAQSRDQFGGMSRESSQTHFWHPMGKAQHLRTSVSRASVSAGRLVASPSCQSFSGPPDAWFGPPPPIRLLKSSSVALLRSELEHARAQTASQEERAKRCNLYVATERMSQGHRRAAHSRNLHNDARRLGRDAEQREHAHQFAAACDQEFALFRSLGNVGKLLARDARSPTLSIARGMEVQPNLFAKSATPHVRLRPTGRYR